MYFNGTSSPTSRLWTRDRDITPATATLDPRPRLWTRDPRHWTRDPRPATISQTRLKDALREIKNIKRCKELHSIPRCRSRLPVVKIDIKKRQTTNKKEYEYKKSVEGWLLKSSYDKSVGRLLRLLNLMMSNNEVDIKTNGEFCNYYYTNFHGHKSPKGFHLPEINWQQKSLKQPNTC